MIPVFENFRPVFLSALYLQPHRESGFFYKVIGTGRTGYRAGLSVNAAAQHRLLPAGDSRPAQKLNKSPYLVEGKSIPTTRKKRVPDYAARIHAGCPTGTQPIGGSHGR
jgi:hypothetical protein